MITIRPVKRALVPVDTAAAQRIMGPNYDEFQSDDEVWDIIQANPDSILRLTMAHCDFATKEEMIKDGSPEALEMAAANLQQLVDGELTRVVENMLWVYEIVDENRPGTRQIGLGCGALTSEIRTDQTPDGTVIRNEGIRDEKAQGRANLISKTNAYIGTVNNTIEDTEDRVIAELEKYADGRSCDYSAVDECGNTHKAWIVTDAEEIAGFTRVMAEEPFAFVADGNHRSAAAAVLGREEYLAVFFTNDRMGLAPYNRLVKPTDSSIDDWVAVLSASFDVEPLGDLPEFQPTETHEIGFYVQGNWLRLRPKAESYDPENAVQAIDSDIIQRKLFDKLLGITDARDPKLTFVGGNKDSAYLKSKVDDGSHEIAITLPPVTIVQFVNVCKQNRFMPPKSTWFEPKIRSGLVVALLD
ncbi:MAG: hypothetical protein CMJ78_25690 [Planctomycetaceae bacterium]|nr:hypothetical protein [Planctomycetaceae bacterium]